MYVLLFFKKYRIKIFCEHICIPTKTIKTGFVHTKKLFALLFPSICFCFLLSDGNCVSDLHKQNEGLFLSKPFQWAALNLGCFYILVLVPHITKEQISSMQTSRLYNSLIYLQLSCNVTALSGYYLKISCLEEDEPSTADFLQQYCRKLAIDIRANVFFTCVSFVNHIILIPAALLRSNNAGSFSKIIFKMPRRYNTVVFKCM